MEWWWQFSVTDILFIFFSLLDLPSPAKLLWCLDKTEVIRVLKRQQTENVHFILYVCFSHIEVKISRETVSLINTPCLKIEFLCPIKLIEQIYYFAMVIPITTLWLYWKLQNLHGSLYPWYLDLTELDICPEPSEIFM